MCNFTQKIILFEKLSVCVCAHAICVSLFRNIFFTSGFFSVSRPIVFCYFYYSSLLKYAMKSSLSMAAHFQERWMMTVTEEDEKNKIVKFAFHQSHFIAFIGFTWKYIGLFHCVRKSGPHIVCFKYRFMRVKQNKRMNENIHKRKA